MNIKNREEKIIIKLNPEEIISKNIQEFYDVLADKFEVDPNHTMYDVRKINVSPSIQKIIWDYYAKKCSQEHITQIWLLYGPKTLDNLEAYSVEIDAGFFVPC